MRTTVLAQILLAGTALAMPQMEKRGTSSSTTATTTVTTTQLGKRAVAASTTIIASAAGTATATARPSHVLAGGSSGALAGSNTKAKKRNMNNADTKTIPAAVVKRAATLTATAGSAATASAAPDIVAVEAKGVGMAKSITRRMKANADPQGLMRTASGALMNAMRNDVDLQTFGQMVEAVKNHASALEEVIKTYSQQADAAGNLDAATQAIDQNQLMADVAAPLVQINGALYDGISRMSMSSGYRPGRGGFAGLGNVAGSYDLVSQLLSVIVLLVSNLGGVTGGTSSTGTGGILGSLLESLLGGLLGGNTLVADPVSNSLNSILDLVNAFVPIAGVINILNVGIGLLITCGWVSLPGVLRVYVAVYSPEEAS